MRVTRIDHVGVVVEELGAAGRLLEDLGLARGAEVDREDLSAHFYGCGEGSVELIEVRDPDQRRTRLREGARARVEHIAIEVDDFDAALATLATLGIATAGPPRAAVGGGRTVFTRADTSGDIMFQFVEPPSA